MLPQLAAGGWTPMPKKLRADSSRMPRPTASVAETAIAGAATGSRWVSTTRGVDAPSACAAIDELLLAQRQQRRTRDARSLHPAHHPDQQHQHRNGRVEHAAATIRSSRRGTDSTASVSLISTASATRPAVALVAAHADADHAGDERGQQAHGQRHARPVSTREKRSRPSSSVPNQCAIDGMARRFARSSASGAIGGQPLRQRRHHDHRGEHRSGHAEPRPCAASCPHPRIDQRIDHIGDQVERR